MEKSYVKLVNEYTYIVQKYFQKRVEIWLETVGKVVFKIKHYWLRFEFAASRGQIHAHMLAISDHNQAFQRCNVFANGDKRTKAEFLNTWAQSTLGMVCNSPVKEQDVDQSKQNNPAKRMWSGVTCLKKDLAECMCFFEKHVCSAYCLQKRKRTEAGEDKESK